MDADEDAEGDEGGAGSGNYASPPCFMHELQDGFVPEAHADRQGWADVARWRKAERQRQIEKRLALSAERRAAMSQGIAAALDDVIGEAGGKLVSFYWPFRGEPDLRGWAATVTARGGETALPLVVEKGRPLVFRRWRQGDRLTRGVWNIPEPAEGEPAFPDVVIAPLVGHDPACYRLGYGGGFFDRTLAALPRKPLAIGVGYMLAALPSIYPQPHDIPMDVIVTEEGVAADRR